LVEAAFTYEGEDGKYLGVETDIEYFENERFKNPYFLILQLNLPRGTEVVKCELTYDERGFVSDWWGVFWIIAGALTLLLLASGIVAIWR